MTDHATPNLPSRDFAKTSAFYGRLGFEEQYSDAAWMILKRGTVHWSSFRSPILSRRKAHSCVACASTTPMPSTLPAAMRVCPSTAGGRGLSRCDANPGAAVWARWLILTGP